MGNEKIPYIRIGIYLVLMIIGVTFFLTRGMVIMNQATGEKYSECGYSP